MSAPRTKATKKSSTKTTTVGQRSGPPAKRKHRPVAPPAPKPERRIGVLSAAAQVLAGSAAPMTCPEMIAEMATRKLWSSPNGKTPAQTLYAAILREIAAMGKDARFVKVERGKFAANS